MGLTEFFSDMTSLMSLREVHAEAPAEDSGKEDGGEEEKADGEDGAEDKAEGEDGDAEAEDAAEGGAEEEGEAEEEEEEEEEEDEPVDQKPIIEAECARSAQCAPYRHHFDECVERVTEMHEDKDYKGPKEDCVEEFFHLQHCATACAAPRLFKQLK